MARKPSITRVKRKYTRRATVAPATTPAPDYIARIATALEAIAAAEQARNSLLLEAGAKPVALSTETVAAQVDAAVKHLNIRSDEPQITHSEPAPVVTPKPRRGRPPKVPRTEPAETVLEKAAEQEFAPHNREPIPNCPCGVRSDLPAHLHAKGCPVHHPAEAPPPVRAAAAEAPPPPPAPTLEDVRAAAITYVGKHGKEKLAALLQKYGADKLSSLAPEKLPALLADIQAGA